MFTTIPEDLGSLSDDELKALAATIKGEVKAALAVDKSSETVALAKLALAAVNEVNAFVEGRALEAAADTPEPEPEPEPEEDGSDAPADEVEEVEEVEEVPVVAAAVPAKVRTRTGVSSAAAAPEPEGRITPDVVLATDGVQGKDAGEQFESWSEVAQALLDKKSVLRHNTPELHKVAMIPGNYAPEFQMHEDPRFNLHLFDEAELTAALCTAPEPSYQMACWNTNRRPMFNSLPRYQNSRGSVSIYPSPSLSDITEGYGQWTFEDDDDDEAVKECGTIQCGDPEIYRMYAVYRCLTIKHNMMMTFPELVEAWLNRLAAAAARYAETLILNAMGNEVDELVMPTLGYNASTTVTTGLLNYLALYQEQQRWDTPGMDAYLHRWWLYAAKADLMRRRTTSGRISVPSDAEVTALFTEAGVTPHFFIDNPAWATAIPSLQVTGRLGQFPRNLEVLVAPKGKFALLDRGELSIGVTGNNMYRDTTNLRKNEITFFVENYEGVVNTTSCPAHLLNFNNLCYNGQQIADIVINCEGEDEVGAAS